MGKASRGLAVIKSDIVGWIYKPKIYLAVFAIIWFVHNNFTSLFQYADSIGCRVNFCLAAHSFTHPYMRILLFCCIIFLMADAPFVTELQRSMMYRAGKGVWYFSQVVYIMISALLLDVLFFVSPLLFHMDEIVIQKSWGRAVYSILKENEVLHSISGSIVARYTPLQALGYYMVILFLLICFIGLFLYLANLLRMGAVGVGILFGFIILDWMIYLVDFTPFLWISPISWVRMDQMAYGLDHSVPSAAYAAAALFVMNVLLCFGIYYASKLNDVTISVKE